MTISSLGNLKFNPISVPKYPDIEYHAAIRGSQSYVIVKTEEGFLQPSTKDLWTDIYYKGTEPPFMRGREREEVSY